MKVHELIPKISAEVGAIGKTEKAQQGYSYRGIQKMLDAMSPILNKHGVFAVPEVLKTERETATSKSGGTLLYTLLTVKYTLYGPEGDCVTAVTVGEGMDSSDKSSNKAMSAAYKYMLGQVFNIPYEMEDAEKENHEPINFKKPTPTISEAQIKRLFAITSEAGVNPEQAKIILKEFGYDHSKDILKKDYDAICSRIELRGSLEAEDQAEDQEELDL